MDVPTLIALLGTLGLGGLITQFAGSGIPRREQRAKFLTSLRKTEAARHSAALDSVDFFEPMLSDLEIAGLMANIPRDAIVLYTIYSRTSVTLAQSDVTESGANQAGGAKYNRPALEKAIDLSVRLMVDVATAPGNYRGPFVSGRISSQVKQLSQSLEADIKQRSDTALRDALVQASDRFDIRLPDALMAMLQQLRHL